MRNKLAITISLLAAIVSSQALAQEQAQGANVKHDMCYGNAVAWTSGRSEDYPAKCLQIGMTSLRALFTAGYRVTASMFVEKMGESAGVFFIEKAD